MYNRAFQYLKIVFSYRESIMREKSKKQGRAIVEAYTFFSFDSLK